MYAGEETVLVKVTVPYVVVRVVAVTGSAKTLVQHLEVLVAVGRGGGSVIMVGLGVGVSHGLVKQVVVPASD